ncbi:caspase family protein [Maritimibacter alkaliphilus]|uniref:caspase family protein n=1 Tax=Maritimibacter alkaliphilus TaxID=404236 RepID=UPI001C97497E|nr:caspase family protein [Maritimibacter alkaliphilus]MBY6089208.1 caspase family protein [Maritimibacter alkaliphilus]
MLRLLVVALIPALVLGSAPLRAAERVALVIGVADYEAITPLANTSNDAGGIAETLDRIGFAVTTLIDPPLSEMTETLKRFSFEAETADLALIYFAGHGVEVQGENYLIPADARVQSNRDILAQSLSLDDLLAAVDSARKMRIVILDSCRDNPFGDVIAQDGGPAAASSGTGEPTASRGFGGLAEPAPDRGTLVAFAAKDGNVALDGKGDHSPFATALMDKLAQPGLEISLMFRQVRDEVLALTGNRQEPHTYGSLSGIPFYIAGGGTAEPDPTLAWSSLRPDDEAQLVALAEEGNTRSLLGLAYMRLNPSDARFDPAQAVGYLQRAADAGSAEAQYELGIQYETGKGVTADNARALDYYMAAARQDYPDALNDLGFFYYQGMLGLPADPQKALIYFERAADQRHPQAMYNFAALIDDGLIGGKGPEEAAGYLYQALRIGNAEVLKVLTEHPDQFKPATRRALQAKLRDNAFYAGALDGDFGPGTRRGLRAAYGVTEN